MSASPWAPASSSPAQWLVSARFDLTFFLLPAVVALALVVLQPWLAPVGDMPLGWWLICIVFVDVAHVWSTLYRTYLDRPMFSAQRRLLIGAPLLVYAALVALAHTGAANFWRIMAYLALFHFIRQQYGWTVLSGRRDTGLSHWDRRLHIAAVYAATIYPVLWWHANLPRDFVWFVPGDFVTGWVTPSTVMVLLPPYCLVLVAFCVRQVQLRVRDGYFRWAKILIVGTTAVCWGVGMVVTNSDWAFSVTNVLIHGVPYVAFVYWTTKRGAGGNESTVASWFVAPGRMVFFVGLLLLIGYGEEWLWDRSLWHDKGALFWGPEWILSDATVRWWMPLLALPQVTHYVLDGFIWRRTYQR